MDLTIRKYTENDLPEIIRIWDEGYRKDDDWALNIKNRQ